MNNLKKILSYGNFKKRVIINWIEFATFIAVWLIINQYLTISIFDGAISSENVNLLISFGCVFILKDLLWFCEAVINCTLRHTLQRDMTHKFRKDLFEKITNANMKFFHTRNSSEMMELILKDSNSAALLLTQHGEIGLLRGFFNAIVFVFVLMFVNVPITFMLLACYLIGFSIYLISHKKTLKLSKELRKVDIQITKQITESLNGFDTIKCCSLEKVQIENLKALLNEYKKECSSLNKNIRKYNFFYEFITLLSMVIIVCFGGLSLSQGAIGYGAIMVFVNSRTKFQSCFNLLVDNYDKIVTDYISFIKILDFLNEDIKEQNDGKLELEKVEKIEFKDVSFKYSEGKNILNNINLCIENNNAVAVIGKTGCGKTTLVNLLCRFYDVTSGEILINGINIKNYTIESLRKQIGYVMQDVTIFNGTILENINYCLSNVSKTEIERICKSLGLHEKISKLDKGYESDMQEFIHTFSSGEKQMLNFARLLVQKPSFLILDEVTSSLSYENEELIKNAINKLTKNQASLIIAHRLSTIKNCDYIIYLNKGEIVDEGKDVECVINKYLRA